jgi:PAS domain S-box-containing protein
MAAGITMNMKTLIVSDDPFDLETIRECLKKTEVASSAASSSFEGLQKYRKERVPVVLVNVDMPGGEALVESLLEERPDLQVIALCDAQRLMPVMENWKHRIAEYLPKPIQTLQLEIVWQRVAEVYRLRRQRKETEMQLEEIVRRKTEERIDTERFLAVRQIVDRMSAFIAQVAGDVHGGVKYFNELPYFVSIHSPDRRILAANPTYIRHLGYRIHGNSWEIYSGKRASRDGCPVGRTLRSEDIMETRALVRYKSGARVPVIVHTAPIFNDDGEIVMVLEIFAGSKEIERLAQEVRTTQQRYHQLFDAVPNPIAVLDRRMRVTAVNRQFKETFGNPLGENFFDILRPGHFPAFRDPVSQTLKDGFPHQGEMVLSGPRGRQYNMMAWSAPIKTLAGKLIQVLTVFTDITQLRQLQDNLSSLGMMIGTISHDLKGCLTGLDAGLYLIDTGFYRDKPGRIEEGLEVCKLMAERIRKLVHDVLFYAKERELEIKTVDVEQFASEVAANVDQRIRGANIDFVVEFEPNLQTFDIDPSLLRSTLINILENAMEACIEDLAPKTHRISYQVHANQNEVCFDIVDNGSGMDAAQKQNIYNLFYTTKGSKGTGLGLFIANKTVQRHGGRITVDSEPGLGAAFHVCLPRRSAATDA